MYIRIDLQYLYIVDLFVTVINWCFVVPSSMQLSACKLVCAQSIFTVCTLYLKGICKKKVNELFSD